MTALAAIASALLLQGCLPRQVALPDPNVPHQVAQPAVVQVWVLRPDGALVSEPVRLEAGWWIASPQVVDPPPTH